MEEDISCLCHESMDGAMFGFFSETVQKFGDRDFQRIKERGSFHGVTYSEAYDQILEIGNGLMSFGVKKHDRVGLICDNRPEWILINLALQGIGAPDVPRDTDVPVEQLAGIIGDSESSFMIVENENVLERIYQEMDTFPSISKIFVIEDNFKPRKNVYSLEDVVNEGRAMLEQGKNVFLEAAKEVLPEDISTIVYTSGTQGIPKGVILTHANFAYQFKVVPPLIKLDENDRVLGLLPPWHLFERIVEYLVFAVGASISYTTPKAVLKDIGLEKPTFFASVPRIWTAVYEKAQKRIKSQKPPLNKMLPRLLERALRHKRAENRKNNRYPDSKDYEEKESFKDSVLNRISYTLADRLVFSKVRKSLGGQLRGAVFGGSHLPEHVEDFLDTAGLEVLEAYGMTEAAPLVSLRRFGGTLHTAGKPIPGTEVQILDQYLNPVESGKQGIIYVRGPQIMVGYTSEELTRRVLSLSSDGSQLKWYNTEDIGLITPSGDLKILGRAGDSFKLLNGEWITPQPIEDAICNSEYIGDAMLVGTDKKFVGALIFPEWDNLKQYAKEQSIDYADDPETANTELSKNKEIEALIESEIMERVSEEKGFRPWEIVLRSAIIDQEPRLGAELTATQKLRRHFIRQEYEPVIDGFFN